MTKHKQAVDTNKAWWEKMVAEGNGFTRPWLELDPAVVRQVASGQLNKAPRPLDQLFPAKILAAVNGKDVLCLASGGGQQSAVFGLLEARVTVFDLAEGQLMGDQQAAEHYGYDVTTIQGDISDLSALDDQTFDVVYQAPSMAYIPDIRKVYSGVARILRPGGLYRADAHNPLAQFIDETAWDGTGYRIGVPYAVKEKQRAEDADVIEYRHDLSETFNGLVDHGFVIEQVVESPPASDLYGEGAPEPGTWLHSELYIPGMYAILARKRLPS